MKYAIDQGIINLDDVRNDMQQIERNRLLSKHNYVLFQDEKDGRWKTTIPDDTKKNGRRLVAKKNKKDVEDVIIEYYKQFEEKAEEKLIRERITLRDIYPLWIQSRKLEVNSLNTVKKNDQDWRRYYLQDEIIDKPINKITVQELKDWAHKKIDDNKLNKRDYYNMATVMKKCFAFAVDSGYLDEDTWSNVKINTKKLKKNQKKANNLEIYFLDEQQKLIQYSFYQFEKNPKNITALAIPLMFVTGVRIGELVGLKYGDVNEIDNIITINKTETVVYDLDDDGNFKFVKKEVADHTKTDAGERMVPLTTYAKDIIHMIKVASEKFGYYDEDFIFCPRSKRIVANTIDKKITHYCEAIGIDKKSAHKIRKTFISRLIHSREIDIDTICRIAGHVDMKTTFTSYCFSLDHKNELQEKIENVLKPV